MTTAKEALLGQHTRRNGHMAAKWAQHEVRSSDAAGRLFLHCAAADSGRCAGEARRQAARLPPGDQRGARRLAASHVRHICAGRAGLPLSRLHTQRRCSRRSAARCQTFASACATSSVRPAPLRPGTASVWWLPDLAAHPGVRGAVQHTSASLCVPARLPGLQLQWMRARRP